jgi:hypothetical protein
MHSQFLLDKGMQGKVEAVDEGEVVVSIPEIPGYQSRRMCLSPVLRVGDKFVIRNVSASSMWVERHSDGEKTLLFGDKPW